MYGAFVKKTPIIFLLAFLLLFLIVMPVSAGYDNSNDNLIYDYSESSDISSVHEYFESIRTDPNLLYAFFLKMPKGGDLHNHLTGAVYAEDIIDISARHDLLVDPATMKIYSNSSKQTGLVLVSTAYNDPALYLNLVDYWSMRDYPENTGSGREWFFSMFGLTSPAGGYKDEMIAAIRDRAAQENVMYIETMLHEQTGNIPEFKWTGNYGEMRDVLLNGGLRESSIENAKKIEEYDLKSWYYSNPAGKNVTVRYLYAAGRTKTKEEVYADLVQAFETANQSPLILGINFVGEEDRYYARTDYQLHMDMIEYLHSVYPDVNIALHAGEQTTGLVPPEDLRFHVAEAINTAHASRIGHGVDIMYETDSEEILLKMVLKDIPVEILLTSNAQILHASGYEHPLSVYLLNEVPIVIATDDPGVERTDLTEQYVQLALQHPELKYEDIQSINENSIIYSFLSEYNKNNMSKQLADNLRKFEKGFLE